MTYDTDVAELEFAQGHGADDHYELGDTVHLFDSQLGIIDLPVRIIKESHNPVQRMKGNVTISNTAGAFIKDISDTVVALQQTTITKESLYNGVKIGPDNGFVATRSDDLVKTSMNATNGISIDMRNTIAASYTPVFYVQTDAETGTAKLYLAGNAVFTGEVIASDIIGGTIAIGSDSNIFNANSTDGIWLGATTFADAPFKVTLSGSVTATDLNMSGGNITGGSITISSDATIGNIVTIGDTDDDIGDTKELKFFESTTSAYGANIEARRDNYPTDKYVNLVITSYDIAFSSFNTPTINGEKIASEVWVSNNLDTDIHAEGNHNHGIPNGTALMKFDGGAVTWAASGGFNHSHIVEKA